MLSPMCSTGRPLPSRDDFHVRDVRSSDKDEVLEFTANTWDFGDYIEYVFDDWLADPSGRFIAAEDANTGRIAAIDKLSFLSPTEAWFEGLRVNPVYRGSGLAASLQTYMISEARRLGAHTARFLTNITNQPVHRMAYRDVFSMQLVVRFWKWVDKSREVAPPDSPGTTSAEPITLREATPEEAPLLYDWWRRASAHATRNLIHENWSYKATSLEEWTQRASQGHLFVSEDTDAKALVLPPPTVLLQPGRSATEDAAWVLSAVTALGEGWEPLMRGLMHYAREQGVAEINGLLPDTVEVYSGMKSAGYDPDSDDERLCVFALTLNE